MALRDKMFDEFFNNRFINNHLKCKLDVMDVGCATGDFIKRCREITNWNLSGIEISKEAAILARQKNPDSSIYIGTIEDLSKESNNKFDIVFCSHVLEHVNKPRVFIERTRDILKERGILYLEAPNERTNFWLWRDNKYSRQNIHNYYSNHKYGHVYFYNLKSLLRLLQDFKTLDIIHKEDPYEQATRKNFLNIIKEFTKRLIYKLQIIFHSSSRIIIICQK